MNRNQPFGSKPSGDPNDWIDTESHVARRPTGFDELKGHRGMKIVQMILLIVAITMLYLFIKGSINNRGAKPPELIEELLPPANPWSAPPTVLIQL